MKKIIGVGLLAGVLMLITGMLTGQVFHFFIPSLKEEYLNPNLFRPWSDPIMSLYFLHPFIVGVIFAWIWNRTKQLFPGNTVREKGLRFGLIYWMISIPGMLISYSSFPVSLLLTFSWSISNLVQGICAGLLFSKMLK